MAPQQPSGQHHHRSTTKVSHKPFKSKHMTKSALKDKSKGKVDSLERGLRHSKQQFTLSKLGRRNQAKQKRLALNSEHIKTNTIFSSGSAAARITAVVPLCPDINIAAVTQILVSSLDMDDAQPIGGFDWHLDIARFKQKVRFVAPTSRNLWSVMDICRVADFVLFVLSPEQEVDALGEQMLRCVESQGVSNVVTVVQGLSSAGNQKKQHQVQDSLKSYITHFFATQEKVHSLDARQECINVMRSLCTTTPKGVRWREDRSWMLVEDSSWEGDALRVTGVVRGRGLNPDRLVQVGDLGDFQIQKIIVQPKSTKSSTSMAVDTSSETVHLPTSDQDALDDLAPEEVVMQDRPAPSLAPSERKGVLLDDHHYFNDDETKVVPAKPRRLPRGTSDYQAAWYLDDVDYSGSDMESVVSDAADTAMPDDVAPDDEMALDAETEYAPTEAHHDASPADEAANLAAYRASRQKQQEEQNDREFPDEIELHPDMSARERLARYRGLKSLRSSTWDTEEDRAHEPSDWRRLLEIGNYKAAKAKMVNEALVGGVAPGSKVEIWLGIPSTGHSSNQSSAQIQELKSHPAPRTLFSLLRHEHKRTAVNASFTLSTDYAHAVKSKTEIVMQCGPRRMVIRPLFSAMGNASNNVHKFDRWVQPGGTSVASFIAPVTWGSVPVLYLRRRIPETGENGQQDGMMMGNKPEAMKNGSSGQDYELIGTGTLLAPSPNRVIAKRAVLTGHPYKIHKRVVTIRYMFFNEEDVEYYKALQLWTRRGRSGFVKESLGTHGYFKASFDGKINPQDAVAVSLYKRVWPRWAETWRPGMVSSG